MKFAFIAKHRSVWPVAWLCGALGVSRSGFHAWLNRSPSQHARYDEALTATAAGEGVVQGPDSFPSEPDERNAAIARQGNNGFELLNEAFKIAAGPKK